MNIIKHGLFYGGYVEIGQISLPDFVCTDLEFGVITKYTICDRQVKIVKIL